VKNPWHEVVASLGSAWRADPSPPPAPNGGTYISGLEEALRPKEARESTPGALDGLTGLASRSAFLDDLHAAHARADRSARRTYCVAVINLDRFRALNEALGHHAADRLLVQVARRLEATRRHRDRAARLGGDEFAVLLEEIADADEAARVAGRILASVEAPVDLQGQPTATSASLGVALATESHHRPEDVLRDAETAMFQAKAQGKGRCQVFSGSTEARALALLRLEVELRRALERDDFRAHYEPSLSVKGGKVTGFEILLWKRSTGRA